MLSYSLKLKQAVENASLFSASLEKGFIVGGISAGAHLATLVAHWARDDAFFEGRKLTGQVLQLPGVVHPDAFPEKSVRIIETCSRYQCNPVFPGTSRHYPQWNKTKMLLSSTRLRS